MSDVIRVLIVEDHPVVAEGLELAFARYGGLLVVGVARTGGEGIAAALREQPDVLLIDFHLPDMTGAEAVTTIRAAHPDIAVVLLSADAGDAALLASVEAGAAGFVLKTRPVIELVDAIQGAAQGELVITAEQMRRALTLLEQRRRESTSRPDLSPRELDILRLAARGLDNKSIAADLGIGLNTVRHHMQNTLTKLDAHSKLDAVARAYELGIIAR